MYILEENNYTKDYNQTEKQEIDLVDTQGHKEKLEVYEEKQEPIKEQEIIKEETPQEVKQEATKVEATKKGPRAEEQKETPKVKVIPSEPKTSLKNKILNFYDKKYKKLMIIPFAMLLIAILVIGIQTATTGSFIHKDVSLKGGVTLTITEENNINLLQLENALENTYKNNDISVRSINKGGKQMGVIIVADIKGTDKAELDTFINTLEQEVGFKLDENNYSIEIMGSSLGTSFFKETFTALIIAFILMSLVVFAYFRTFIPSLAVILSAVSDIIVTVAIVDLMGMKISTGGIAGFLMLVGYSVDTDMLLTTRLLKRKEGTVFDRTIGSVKTGMLMSITTIGAITVALIFSQSAVITQILTIVFIGLFVDIINTWIQNVGILRLYIEKKQTNKNE